MFSQIIVVLHCMTKSGSVIIYQSLFSQTTQSKMRPLKFALIKAQLEIFFTCSIAKSQLGLIE